MSECSLTNLGTCLPEKFFEYIAGLTNAPLQYLLDLNKSLMTVPLDITQFSYFWAIIVYILSMFYGLLIVYVGFNFMFSGHNVVKRENAKSWLKNVIIMIVLVQASLFIYELMLDLGSVMTTVIINLIDDSFFNLSSISFTDFGLELAFSTLYLFTLIATLLLLLMRYMMLGIGVILFPIGIFLYFIQPLRTYGKFILNLIMITVFMSFFHAIILLIPSMLMEMPMFEDIKIVLMICAFGMINTSFFVMLYIAWKKADSSLGISRGIRTIAGLVVKFAG